MATTPLDLSLERKKRENIAADFTVKETLQRALDDVHAGEFDGAPHALVVIWKKDAEGKLWPTFYTNVPSRYTEVGMIQVAYAERISEMWCEE